MKTWKHLTFEQRKVIANGISKNYKLKEIEPLLRLVLMLLIVIKLKGGLLFVQDVAKNIIINVSLLNTNTKLKKLRIMLI